MGRLEEDHTLSNFPIPETGLESSNVFFGEPGLDMSKFILFPDYGLYFDG